MSKKTSTIRIRASRLMKSRIRACAKKLSAGKENPVTETDIVRSAIEEKVSQIENQIT